MTQLTIWLLSSFSIIAFFVYLLNKIVNNYEKERIKYERYKNKRY